jgi:hypothetical protein
VNERAFGAAQRLEAHSLVLLGVVSLAALTASYAHADTPEALGDEAASSIPAPDAFVALKKPRMRKVAVPRFRGASADTVRQAVLDALSEHNDLEIIGQPDLEVVANRLGLTVEQPKDRQRLSSELGLYAWFDGDGDRGEIRVTDASGTPLGKMKLKRGDRMEEQVMAGLWHELGRYVSDEGMREYLVSYCKGAALQKLEALDAELARQKELAAQRAKQRAERLEALKKHARARVIAQQTELVHQSELAGDRVRREQKEAAKQAEAARQAEIARQKEAAKEAEAARQAEIARQKEAARQAELMRQQELARQAELARQNAYAAQAAAPAPGYGYPQPAPAASAVYAPQGPTGRFTGPGAAPAAPPAQPAQPAYPPAGYAPAPAPAPAPPGGEEVPGISPETRQWLLEHRSRQR